MGQLKKYVSFTLQSPLSFASSSKSITGLYPVTCCTPVETYIKFSTVNLSGRDVYVDIRDFKCYDEH